MKGIIQKFNKSNWYLMMWSCITNTLRIFFEAFLLVRTINLILNDIVNNAKNNRKIVVFCCVLLLIILMRIISREIEFILKKRMTITLENEIIERTINNNMVKEDDEILLVVQNTINTFSQQYIDNFTTVCITAMTIITIAIYSVSINITAITICVIILICALLIINNINKKLVFAVEKSEHAFNNTYMLLWECLDCLRILPFCNDNVYKIYQENINKTIHYQTDVSKILNISRICERFSNIGIILIISLIYGFKAIRGEFDIANLFTIIVLFPKFSDAIFKIPIIISNIDKQKGLLNIIEKSIEGESGSSKDIKCEDIISIEAKNIIYKYENNIDCHINYFEAFKGEIIGIYGKSGIGKSTFLNLLVGLLKINEGNIVLNGEYSISEIDLESFWNNILYVGQESVLLPMCIYQNIALEEMNCIDKRRMKFALAATDLEKFEKNNFDNVVDETNISTGEKQKICIARCFYLKRKLYILDEATNAISPQAEEKIIRELFKKIKNEQSILIIVSHNKSLIDKCDRFYKL